jgi:hypothetical protein
MAVEMFYILEGAGEKFNPLEIKGYMISLGWKDKDADKLADIPRKMNAGIRPRRPPKPRPWASDILSQWRQTADGGTDAN